MKTSSSKYYTMPEGLARVKKAQANFVSSLVTEEKKGL